MQERGGGAVLSLEPPVRVGQLGLEMSTLLLGFLPGTLGPSALSMCCSWALKYSPWANILQVDSLLAGLADLANLGDSFPQSLRSHPGIPVSFCSSE